MAFFPAFPKPKTETSFAGYAHPLKPIMLKQPILCLFLLLTALTAHASPPQADNANQTTGNSKTHNQTVCGTRLDQVTTADGVIQYTYFRRQMRLKSITTPSGTTTYSYTSTSVTETPPSGPAIVYNLDATGLATSDSRGVTYTYVNGYCTQIAYPAGAVGNETAFVITNCINSGGNIYRQERIGWQDHAWYLVYTSYPTFENDQMYLGRKNSSWPMLMQESDGTNVAYTYETDGCGRVSTQTITTTAPDGTVTTTTNTYTYY
jgi:hypothetical protein